MRQRRCAGERSHLTTFNRPSLGFPGGLANAFSPRRLLQSDGHRVLPVALQTCLGGHSPGLPREDMWQQTGGKTGGKMR